MPKSHDIPEWYLPDGETLLGEPRGEAEQEHFEETGELLSDDPEVCPHCGEEYQKETDGYFVHSWVPVGDGSRVKMGLTCLPSGEKRNVNKP